MRNDSTRTATLTAVTLALMAAVPVSAAAPPPVKETAPVAKQAVRTKDDLPRNRYPVPDTAVGLLNADEVTFNAWAKQVDADSSKTLAGYDIQDHATLRELLSNQLNYQLLTHQDQAALATVRQIRALQDKPDAKLTSGVRTEAILKARIATGAASGPAFERAYAENYAAALDALPWAVVGNVLKESRGNAQLGTASLLDGFIAQELDPAVSRDHQISDEPAGTMLRIRMMKQVELPLKATTIAVLSKVITAKNVVKPDIWAAREVTLTAADRTTPVVAAVWDSGTDLALFPTQTYTDPQPPKGLPYHEHGLAFDVESRPEAGWLYPLSAAEQAAYPRYIADFQGLADLQQAIDSPAADALKAKLAGMPAAQQPAYFEQLSLYGNYLHGTHVAGIMARGNPAIRLASARLTYDYRNVPIPPTDELMQRAAAAYQTYVDWFRTHGVRVVNMSWGGTPGDYETVLEKNGIGKDAAERKALARHYFAIDRDSLLKALKSAPEVLFVAAAGNSNGDNGFEETIPSMFVLPNLLTVSAVDRGGDEASFTTYGKNVAVSANGYQVDSVIPGGQHLLESGTSMASPNVANLAAKLIALDPKLTPEETIVLIKRGATPSADARRRNIDPKASVGLLKRAQKN